MITWTEPRLFDVDVPKPEQLDVFDALGTMTIGAKNPSSPPPNQPKKEA